MIFSLPKKSGLRILRIDEKGVFCETNNSCKKLPITINKAAAINGSEFKAGESLLNLHIGFNYFKFENGEYLSVLRHAPETLLGKEFYRPRFHYTVPISLLNDPNGLVYNADNGTYNMFFQYQGNYMPDCECKSWGHAVSRDLISWRAMPAAILPDALGEIYSGSCVIDCDNTSGLFNNATPPDGRIAALYTSCDRGLERQSLAYSEDGGKTFIKYKGNPVIDNFINGKQVYTLGFRDPKVLRIHTNSHPQGIWLMIVAGEQARLYTSENLINWKHSSDLFYKNGEKILSECPDLFPITSDCGQTKWVYIGNDYSDGDSRIFYIIGELVYSNGKYVFLAETDGSDCLCINPECYASQTYYNDSRGRRLLTAWMRDWVLFDGNTWQFDEVNEFSKYWLGTLTLPYELKLTGNNKDGFKLKTTFAEEVCALRKNTICEYDACPAYTKIDGNLTEIVLSAENNPRHEVKIVWRGDDGEFITAVFSPQSREFKLDRRHSRTAAVPEYKYKATENAPFSLRILTDKSIIEAELFGGEKIFNCQYYFTKTPYIEIYAHPDDLLKLKAYALKETVTLKYETEL